MANRPPLTAEEAAQILKISKYTFYELVKRGELPVQRIGRQIRIDPDVLDQYLRGSQPNPNSRIGITHTGDSADPDKADFSFVGSHDPIIGLLTEFLKYSSHPVDIHSTFTGSLDGLFALYKRKADFTGIHLWDDKTESYNLPFIHYILPGESVKVINLVQRIQGWMVPSGNPLHLQSFEDISKPGLRFVNRQKGSGTRLRIDSFLKRNGISPTSIKGYETEEQTHYAVACTIANGDADAGIGVQSAAIRTGLDFIPLFREQYDLVCLEKTAETPQWQQIVTVLQSPAFQKAIQNQPGYDTTLTGTCILQEKYHQGK